MTYFDAAYIAKCYLNEPGADRVREFARTRSGLTSSEWGRVEFACIVNRHVRERDLSTRHARSALADFAEDEASGVWHWIPVTSALLERTFDRVRNIQPSVFLRAGDAIHLATAGEHGYREVYTNDRHMLLAAPRFGLEGIDIIASA